MVTDIPKTLNSRYRLGEIVGLGGMGTVLVAHDHVLDRRVAVKLLKPELSSDPEMVARFRREARISAAIVHPGIAQVYDFSEDDGHSFIVMEYVDGEDLHALVSREGTIEPLMAASIVARAADALQFAHESGAVHRDIKPGNILLTRSGEVKITDFGIARAAGQAPVTTIASMMGTPFYIAPEQAKGLPPSPSGDIYSLGCVLFELLTGTPPFSGDTPVAIAMAHINQDPPLTTDLNPDVPEEIERVVEKSLEKEPGERFLSADDFAWALRRAVGTVAPISAIPPVESAETRRIEIAPRAASSTQELGPPIAAASVQRAADKIRRRWGPVVAVAVLAIVIFALIAIAGMVTPAKQLPDWTGRPVEVVEADAAQLGLKLVKEPAVSTQPTGVVIAQDPPAGVKLDDVTTVRLTYSIGGVAVPSVSGNKLERAIETLKEAGLKVRVEGTTDESATVIDQIPAGGELVAPGSEVVLVTRDSGDEKGHGKGRGGD